MKTLIAASILASLLASGVTVMAQEQNEDYLGLPGDNLNLYAVMKLFQESKTLDEFERSINDENSRINNLDLNGDNMIDYINVFDNVKGSVHNIVMQVAVSEKERQDVAVFTVERDKKGNVMLQLTGDEELYGKNYILEPAYDEGVSGETPNPGYTGNAATVNGRKVVVVRTTMVEIANWPVITYIYDPGYVVWRSSWYWGYYPTYWNPWRPYYWHYYYGYHYNYYDYYYGYYRRSYYHRHNYWHDYYYRPHHTHSTYVTVNIKNGHYKSTYSRPDERSKGEALYSSTHRDNGSRRQDNSRVDNQSRRSVTSSTPAGNSNAAGSSNSRRVETGAQSRTETSTRARTTFASGDRASSGTSTQRNASGEVNRNAGVQSGKSDASVSRTRTTGERSAVQSKSSDGRSSVQTRSTVERSQAKSPSAGRSEVQSRPSEGRPSVQSRSSSKGAASKSAAPSRRESKPSAPAKSESRSKSSSAESKSDNKRR